MAKATKSRKPSGGARKSGVGAKPRKAAEVANKSTKKAARTIVAKGRTAPVKKVVMSPVAAPNAPKAKAVAKKVTVAVKAPLAVSAEKKAASNGASEAIKVTVATPIPGRPEAAVLRSAPAARSAPVINQPATEGDATPPPLPVPIASFTF